MDARDYMLEFSRILGMLESRSWRTDFDRAEVALAILRERAKDRRMKAIGERRGAEPATDGQRGFMKDLGIEFDEGITKRDASREIDKALSSGGR